MSKPTGRFRSVGGGVGGSSTVCRSGDGDGGDGDGDVEGPKTGEDDITGDRGAIAERRLVDGPVESSSLSITILLVLRDGLGSMNGSEDVL